LDEGPEVDGTAAKPRQMAGFLELAQAAVGDPEPLGGLGLRADDRLHEHLGPGAHEPEGP
jgi:hypothetical protein